MHILQSPVAANLRGIDELEECILNPSSRTHVKPARFFDDLTLSIMWVNSASQSPETTKVTDESPSGQTPPTAMASPISNFSPTTESNAVSEVSEKLPIDNEGRHLGAPPSCEGIELQANFQLSATPQLPDLPQPPPAFALASESFPSEHFPSVSSDDREDVATDGVRNSVAADPPTYRSSGLLDFQNPITSISDAPILSAGEEKSDPNLIPSIQQHGQTMPSGERDAATSSQSGPRETGSCIESLRLETEQHSVSDDPETLPSEAHKGLSSQALSDQPAGGEQIEGLVFLDRERGTLSQTEESVEKPVCLRVDDMTHLDIMKLYCVYELCGGSGVCVTHVSIGSTLRLVIRP